MKEINDIIKAYDNAIDKSTALATVVHVDGSSYRRPGARMLITEDGQLTGAISGGCLEGDALRKALLVMKQGKPMLVTYDTNDEDDAKFGLGLGCNGIIQVLIEPINASDQFNPVNLLKQIASKRKNAVAVTVFSMIDKNASQAGTCFLINDDQKTGASPFIDEILTLDAKVCLSDQQSAFKNYVSEDKSITAFLEFIQPAISLVIVGTGNDVKPMIEMAGILGWKCKSIRPKDIAGVEIDNRTVVALMTHNFNHDMALLQTLLPMNLKYVGMIGPMKKRQRMLDELAAKGVFFSEEQLAALHSPAGLNIGAESPEEIALSIIAEIKSVMTGKSGESLRERKDAIHSREETSIQKIKLSQ